MSPTAWGCTREASQATIHWKVGILFFGNLYKDICNHALLPKAIWCTCPAAMSNALDVWVVYAICCEEAQSLLLTTLRSRDLTRGHHKTCHFPKAIAEVELNMVSACVGWACREISLAFWDSTDQEILDAKNCAIRIKLLTQDQAIALTTEEWFLFCKWSIPQAP